MTVQWPDNSKSRFGKDILQASHSLDISAAFSEAGLADILDAIKHGTICAQPAGSQLQAT